MKPEQNKLPPYLYHVTSARNTWDIIDKGLLPKIGKAFSLEKPDSPCIFLCGKKDIAYWAALLGHNTAVRIDTEKLDQKLLGGPFAYTLYSEYTYKGKIPASCISRASVPKLTVQQKKELYLEYIYQASRMCVRIADYYLNRNITEESRTEIEYMMECSIPCMLHTVKNMDFSVITASDMKTVIKEISDGGFAFTDRCDFTHDNCRLYEKLIRYKNDRFSETRKNLYGFITETFTPVLNMDTGGWIL